jgi:hypothetical protein
MLNDNHIIDTAKPIEYLCCRKNKSLIQGGTFIMVKKISKKEANALFSYEPLESEFRTRAYKIWRNVNVDVSMFGMSRKRMEQYVGF